MAKLGGKKVREGTKESQRKRECEKKREKATE